MSRLLKGREFIEALCDRLNIPSDYVRDVTIHAAFDGVVTIRIIQAGDERLLNLVEQMDVDEE